MLGPNYRSLMPPPPPPQDRLAMQLLQSALNDSTPNPNAATIIGLNQQKAQLDALQKNISANPAPVEPSYTPSQPMPMREQVPVPQQQRAHLNPIAVALSLFGPNTGATIGNMANSAVAQTRQNFETDMQRYGALADQAAQAYHDQLNAYNEKKQNDMLNHDINFSNAKTAYKTRDTLGGIDAQRAGIDTASRGLSTLGEQEKTQTFLEAKRRAAENALPDWLKAIETATSADRNVSQINQVEANTAHMQGEEKRAQSGFALDQAGAQARLEAQQAATAGTKQRTANEAAMFPIDRENALLGLENMRANIALTKARSVSERTRGSNGSFATASDINAALRGNDETLKSGAADLQNAWSQYRNAEFGKEGRLAYMESVRKSLFNGKTPPSRKQLDVALNGDRIYQGLAQASNDTVRVLHQTDAAFQQTKIETAAGRERIMRSSKVPGMASAGARPGMLPGGYQLIGVK